MSIIQSIFSPRAETSTLSPAQQWLIDIFGGNKTSSGENVNSSTSLGLSAYFACIRNISEDVGKLPRHVYRRLQPRGKERATDDPRYRMIHESPNDEMSAMEFEQLLTSHALGWRGGFAEIVRRGDGKPIAMYPIDPTTVTVRRSGDGTILYDIQPPDGPRLILTQRDVLHIHGLGFDGITGYLLSWIARESLGGALAKRNYGGTYFGNGAQLSGILEVPAGFSQTALENLRDSWKKRHEGSENKHKTAMLEHGVTYKVIENDPQKSQMIESLEFDIEDVARWFRVPPNKIGHFKRAQGWSTVEMLNTDYVVDTLTPWLVRWEQEYKRKLFAPSESDLFVEHVVNGLLRGDAAARASFYSSQFNIGALSSNDIREMENLNPTEGGDTYYVQGAMIPVDLQREKMEAEIEKLKELEPEPTPPNSAPPEDGPESNDEPENRLSRLLAIADAHEPLLIDAFARVLRTEADFVTRAMKRDDGAERCKKFYQDHEQHVIAAIGPVIEAFWVAATGKPADMDTIRQCGADHVAASTTNGIVGVAHSSWTDGRRASAQAKLHMARMVERIANSQTVLGGTK